MLMNMGDYPTLHLDTN